MSVTAARGFRACGVSAGITAGAGEDVAIVVNDGPRCAAAGVFTSNRLQAAPVLWSRQVLTGGELRAVVLNSGGANACTGPLGFQDTHRTAEHAAALLGVDAARVAVCSAGVIGSRLPMDSLLRGLEHGVARLSRAGGGDAASAIRGRDAAVKNAVGHGLGFTVGGMAGGASLGPAGLGTVLAVLTTDADLDAAALEVTLRQVAPETFDRIDAAGCASTNDSVLLLASGVSGVTPAAAEFLAVVEDVCADLARQLVADADGASREVLIEVEHAANEADARQVCRALAQRDLLAGSVLGGRQHWARVLAAIGATSASFEPDRLSLALDGVWVFRHGSPAEPRPETSEARPVRIRVDLAAGPAALSAWTNDLASAYIPQPPGLGSPGAGMAAARPLVTDQANREAS
jgi:glutamate N-acetyltransferase/amino-acid N-acetyltransferase